MPIVRIIRPWKSPDWLRQTPGGAGEWNGCRFTEEPVFAPDFAIVCNHVDEDVGLHIAPERVWLVVQEPPVRLYHWLRAGYMDYGRIFGPDPVLSGGVPHIWQHGCLPWHVGKSFDQLTTEVSSAKTVDLTWITSNASIHSGHRLRLRFLEKLRARVPLQLYGRGFKAIADKWQALAPARYALAIENFSGPHYWTEKVADCFLAGAMPLYWGATNLGDYFPEESFVWIDIADRKAPQRVAEIVKSKLAERNREALLEARRRVLMEYQFFPLMSREIADHVKRCPSPARQDKVIPLISDMERYRMSTPFLKQAWHAARRRYFGVGS